MSVDDLVVHWPDPSARPCIHPQQAAQQLETRKDLIMLSTGSTDLDKLLGGVCMYKPNQFTDHFAFASPSSYTVTTQAGSRPGR